jgi:hypothetical protein
MARTTTAEQEDAARELHANGMTLSAIARQIGVNRDTIAAIINPATDVPSDMNYVDYYWPHIAPPPPSAPAAEVLDYRLSRAERAALQHRKKD